VPVSREGQEGCSSYRFAGTYVNLRSDLGRGRSPLGEGTRMSWWGSGYRDLRGRPVVGVTKSTGGDHEDNTLPGRATFYRRSGNLKGRELKKGPGNNATRGCIGDRKFYVDRREPDRLTYKHCLRWRKGDPKKPRTVWTTTSRPNKVDPLKVRGTFCATR